MRHIKKSGFTLLELAIVLVIVGLIAGSIVSGATMVRTFEMRKIQRQSSTYITAVNTFRIKYHCLPGDCENAEDLFGSDATCPPAGGSAPNTLSCNGDSDGTLNTANGTNGIYEPYEVWRQLADAGLVGGVYSGTWYNGNTTGLARQTAKAGYNCPPILDDSNCWLFFDVSDDPLGLGHIIIVNAYYGNTVLAMISTSEDLGAPSAQLFPPLISDAQAIGLYLRPGAFTFTPAEAAAFDSKYDDGNPVTGHILAESGWWIKRCTTTQDASAKYAVSQYTDRNCNLFYTTNF